MSGEKTFDINNDNEIAYLFFKAMVIARVNMSIIKYYLQEFDEVLD